MCADVERQKQRQVAELDGVTLERRGTIVAIVRWRPPGVLEGEYGRKGRAGEERCWAGYAPKEAKGVGVEALEDGIGAAAEDEGG